jgi:acetoin utilization protein AcuB
LAKVSSAIFGVGGNIVGLGVSEAGDIGEMPWEITFKVQDVPRDKLLEAIRPVVDDILEARET